MTYSTLELKYCERCGGLGLRRDKLGLPYCADCEQMLARLLLQPPSSLPNAGHRRRAVVHLGERLLAKPATGIRKQEAVYAC